MKKLYKRLSGLSPQYYSFYASLVFWIFSLIIFSNLLAMGIIWVAHQIIGLSGKYAVPIVLLSFLALSCLIGTGFTAVFGKVLLRPLEDVIKAMKRIEKGDYTVRVDDEYTKGEIKELVNSYNKMAEELSGVEMFREDFINSYSHEFKTPIVSIQGFAKQLKKSDLSEEKKQEYIDIIISESKRLTGLSSNILLLNSLENCMILSDKTTFRLDEQIRSCVLLLEKQWSAKSLEFDIDMQAVEYTTNAEMLSQAWVNIIGNAIKFSPEENRIRILLTADEDEITVTIADRGIGMKPETIKHIFERFYQGDNAHALEGNGLGLPLVKRIIELNDGNIRVESQYGQGTRFIVTLPRVIDN